MGADNDWDPSGHHPQRHPEAEVHRDNGVEVVHDGDDADVNERAEAHTWDDALVRRGVGTCRVAWGKVDIPEEVHSHTRPGAGVVAVPHNPDPWVEEDRTRGLATRRRLLLRRHLRAGVVEALEDRTCGEHNTLREGDHGETSHGAVGVEEEDNRHTCDVVGTATWEDEIPRHDEAGEGRPMVPEGYCYYYSDHSILLRLP